MKKLLSILLITAISLSFLTPAATAQTPASLGVVKSFTASKTALTNADTANLVVYAPTVRWNAASFTVSVTKGTGTVAGTIVLMGRNQTSEEWAIVSALTYTMTDIAKNPKSFTLTIPETSFKQYNVQVKTSGTVTATVVPGSAVFWFK